MTAPAKPPRFAVSTWSVRRLMAETCPDKPEAPASGATGAALGGLRERLLALPQQAARRGVRRLEFCHFHLSRHDRGFLAALKASMSAAGVTAQSLLIDDGDVSDGGNRQRDLAWIGAWLEVAAELGVEQARVIAGKQAPTAETLALSIAGLREAARLGRSLGVKIITENWFALLATPRQVHHVLDALGGEVGFLADTGNWKEATKYADLESVFGRAQYCHARAAIDGGYRVDIADFGQGMSAARRAGFDGPFTLIYDGVIDDEWRGLELMRDFVAEHAAAPLAVAS